MSKAYERSDITPSVLHLVLTADPDVGSLVWKGRCQDMFLSGAAHKTWNTRYAGKVAFTANIDGYKVGRIFGMGFRAHRVIWALETGAWPKDGIDHINGDRSDNRISNLRECTQSQNCRNRGAVKGRYCGVRWHNNIWQSHIGHMGKFIYCLLYTSDAADE